MQKAEYSVSIIIPTMNRPLELAVCLDSISKQSLRPKQTIVIEAGKEDLSENMLREKYPEVLFLRFPESSLTSARNRAIKDAEGDIVIFLDDDIILEPGFVYAMTEVFKIKGLSSIGGVCGNITNQISGSEKWMHRLILKAFFMGESGSGKFKISGAPTFVYGSNRVKEVEFIPGGITAYRRSLFDEFLFDEKLKGYCYGEDADFSYRISRKYKNYYTRMQERS